MQELLNTFGIQPILLVAQIVNFLIIFYLLKRFAWKPILKTLQDRRSTVAQGIKNAEDAQKALDQALEKEKEILRKAQTSAQELLTDAKKQALEVANATQDQARVRVEKMIEEARHKIDKQTQDVEKQLALKVTTLATDLLKVSLKGMLGEKEEQTALEMAVKNLKR